MKRIGNLAKVTVLMPAPEVMQLKLLAVNSRVSASAIMRDALRKLLDHRERAEKREGEAASA